MKKSKKLFALLTTIFIVSLLLCTTAMAYQEDGAGNATETQGTNQSIEVEGDYIYFFSPTNTINDNTVKGTIGGDLIAAANTIGIEATVGGNIRAAAQSIVIDNSSAKNVTIAAYTIEIGDDTEFNSIYAAGQKVTVDGTCEYLEIWANEVYIYGTVTNGAVIHADSVFFADTCNIDKVTVEGTTAPYTFDGKDIKTKKAYTQNTDFASKVTFKQIDNEITNKVSGLLYTLPAAIILVLLLCLLTRKPLDEANTMLKYGTGKMIGLGFAGFIGIPIISIILLFLPYTQTIAFALILLYILFAIIAVEFTAASVARMLLPKLNKYLSSLIGVTVIAVASILPTISLLFGMFSLVYIFGYLLSKVFTKKEQTPPLQNESFQM